MVQRWNCAPPAGNALLVAGWITQLAAGMTGQAAHQRSAKIKSTKRSRKFAIAKKARGRLCAANDRQSAGTDRLQQEVIRYESIAAQRNTAHNRTQREATKSARP